MAPSTRLRGWVSAFVGVLAATTLCASAATITVGQSDSVMNNGVSVSGDGPFTLLWDACRLPGKGTVTQWRFNGQFNDRAATPLIVSKDGTGTYRVTGIGTTRTPALSRSAIPGRPVCAEWRRRGTLGLADMPDLPGGYMPQHR